MQTSIIWFFLYLCFFVTNSVQSMQREVEKIAVLQSQQKNYNTIVPAPISSNPHYYELSLREKPLVEAIKDRIQDIYSSDATPQGCCAFGVMFCLGSLFCLSAL